MSVAVEAALEADPRDVFVCDCTRLGQIAPARHDRQDAPAGRHDAALVVQRRARVEHLDTIVDGVQARDRRARGVGPGVSAARHRDGDGRLLAPGDRAVGDRLAARRRRERCEQIALDPRQHRLRLGVAEAAVELEHVDRGIVDHQPRVHQASELAAHRSHRLRDGLVHAREHVASSVRKPGGE